MNIAQVPTLNCLEIAGNMLDRHEGYEAATPGLLQVTGVSQHGAPTASGHYDYDYQPLLNLSLGHKNLNQIETVNKVPIPPEILEHFKHIKCHWMMGLFPEISRAWLTIDSDIYIWTYENSRDVAYFDGLNQLIVSVGLIKPKAGVFVSDVKYLLVLTTVTEIVVLGVTFSDATKTLSSLGSPGKNVAEYEEMQLMNKPIFVLSTDNVAITTVRGSCDGRIFLGGRDGNLYELHYQAETSWLGKRFKKINLSQSMVSYMIPNFLKIFSEIDSIVRITVDNTRQLLYTLSENGAIEAWDIGESYSATRHIARASQNDVVSRASHILGTVDPAIFKPIKSICALTENDCPNLHLLAVSDAGVRFYFSVYSLTATYQNQQISGGNVPPSFDRPKPQDLYLMHIRLPPGYAPNTTNSKPKDIHVSYYSGGAFLMIASPPQEIDILWSISSEPFPQRPYLMESTEILNLDGKVWEVCESPDRNRSKSFIKSLRRPKKVVILSTQGTHTLLLLRPVDILQQLLIACRGPHHEAVKGYFQAQSEAEACATCLLLAATDNYRGSEVALWAAQAFMLYGGEPHFGGGYLLRQANTQRSIVSPGQRSSPPRYMSTPFSDKMQSNLPPNLQHSQYPLSPIGSQATPRIGVDGGNINYSAKHAGLYLHVLRLLRPVWRNRCITTNWCSTISQSDCCEILQDLYALSEFLDVNSASDFTLATTRLFTGQNMTNGFVQGHNNVNLNEHKSTMEQAQFEENQSLVSLNFFIKHTAEILALWKIICEHQFLSLINHLTEETKNILLTCTFRELILLRTETCAHLIVALINSYLSDKATVNAISAKLREVCPNLYRHEDAVSHKAIEILISAKNCIAKEEKDEKLRTALELCKDAAPHLPLTNICQQFALAGFYQGVIELATICAAKVDPKEAALHFYRNNEPIEDHEGCRAFAARMKCYEEVKRMLDMVYQERTSAQINAGLADYSIQAKNNNNDLRTEIMKIVSFAIQVSDTLLHVVVYEWLLLHNLLSELLALTEPSLDEFFKRSVDKNPDNLQLADLRWKYYERNGHHALAAKILDNLATKETHSITLKQRIEYLARAVMCMRNEHAGYSANNGILLKDLEDKLEIARVQMYILESVSSLQDSERIKEKLNFTLYDITQLYMDFAEPLELWECKLTILNCSHHNDPRLIQSVWRHILDEAVEEPGSGDQKYSRLIAKVQSLVKEFGNSGHCFPLAFLVRELEIKCCQLKPGNFTVPEALISMDLDIELLVDSYARMISMNERVWANEGNEWHLVQAAASLISKIIENSNQIPNRNKRRIVSKAQDLISSCLHLLYPKSATDDELIRVLKEIQIKLQRILQ